MRLIRTKTEFLELAQRGLVGNVPKTWKTPAQFLEESDDAFVGLRMLTPGSDKFRAFVPREEVAGTIKELGLSEGEYYLSVTIFPDEIKILGELTHYDGRWVLYYSHKKGLLRDSLAEAGQYAYGEHEVWGLLSRYCTPSDIADLIGLFELYSPWENYPIIEFTVTHSDCGIFPNRNTLIWEVRHY